MEVLVSSISLVKMKIRQFICAFLLLSSLTGCGIIGAVIIAKIANPKISITSAYLRSTNRLSNGVSIEKLQVLAFDKDSLPQKFQVTDILKCKPNPETKTQKRAAKKISFKRPSKQYSWTHQKVALTYEIQKNRMILLLKPKEIKWELTSESPVFPIRFDRQSWYIIRTYDNSINRLFLNVDEQGKFHLTKILSSRSPI